MARRGMTHHEQSGGWRVGKAWKQENARRRRQMERERLTSGGRSPKRHGDQEWR